MAFAQIVVMLISTTLAWGQRPSFAGTRPIGYPDVVTTTTVNPLQDRFGEDSNVTTTTQRLPVEALGDRDLVDRLSKLPIDKQPFWFINWQALEAHRQKPQSFPQRPSQFAQPLAPNTNSGIVNTNAGNANLNSFNENPNSNSGASVNTNSAVDNINRNSEIASDNAASVNPNFVTASPSTGTITGAGASLNFTTDNINSETTNDKASNTVANFIMGNSDTNSRSVNTNYDNSPNAYNKSEKPFVNLSTLMSSFDSASTNSNLQARNTFSDSVLSNKQEVNSTS